MAQKEPKKERHIHMDLTMPPLQTMIFTMTAVMMGLICVASFTFISSLIVMGKLATPDKKEIGAEQSASQELP
jgi:hypothetical protein